jgi:hypothetical protein
MEKQKETDVFSKTQCNFFIFFCGRLADGKRSISENEKKAQNNAAAFQIDLPDF